MTVLFRTCVFGGALLLVISGLVLIFIGEPIRNHLISSQFVINPDSSVFSSWRRTPEPLPQEFYFFNWTNPEHIYNASIKPKFEEVGPYKYDQIFEKQDIQWNDNGTVTFRQNKFWFYKNGSLSDEINLVNPVVLSMAYTTRFWGYLTRKAAAFSIATVTSKIYLRRSIEQLLFEGYTDPILQTASTFSVFSKDFEDMDRFGLLYKKNGSARFNGVFNVETGEKGPFAKLNQWNHKNRTEFYEDQCGEINACLGDFFGRNVPKTRISFFSPDLCRVLTLQYVEEAVVDDILGYKFIVGDYALDNGTKYPENSCFSGGESTPSGLFNISACRGGAPFFVSMPHFYNADPYYTSSVEGLNPDREKHDFYMIIEPVTGIPLEVSAKLQVNLLVLNISGIRIFENIPHKYFLPLMWYKYKVKIPSDKTTGIKFLVDIPQISKSIGIGLIFIGLVLFVVGFGKSYWDRKCHIKKNQILQEQSVPLKKAQVARQ